MFSHFPSPFDARTHRRGSIAPTRRALLHAFLLFLTPVFALPCLAQSDVTRVLLVGDSWSGYLWSNRTMRAVFQSFGKGNYLEKGDVTAIGGTTAAQWATASYLNKITQELAANPTIDCVQICLGGNDALAGQAGGGWHTGLSPEQVTVLVGRILTNIETVVKHVLSVRPEATVILCGYDFPNFVESVDQDPFGPCALMWANLGRPLPSQINGALSLLEAGKRDLALAYSPAVFYVHNQGLMQYLFGYPSLGVPPGAVPYPGVYPVYSPFPGGAPDYPSPPEAMNGFGGRLDCIHLNRDGYLGIGTSCWYEFYQYKFTEE